MTVPVHANLFPGWLHHFFKYKAHERECAHRSSVSGRVADHDGAGATINRCLVETLDHLRIAARRVFGDIHHAKSQRNRVFHGALSGLQEEVVGPAFGVAANWTGAQERCRFDIEAGSLHDLRDRTNIVLMSAGGAIRADFHLVIYDLSRQSLDVLDSARPGPGQSE